MPSRRAIKHQVREENNLARTLTVKALNSTSSTAATELAGKLRQIPANSAGTDECVKLALLALCFLVLQRGRPGGKTPAVTVSQMRVIFTELLRKRPPTAWEIADAVSRVLRRSEEARIYYWYSRTKTFPPRRPRPGFS